MDRPSRPQLLCSDCGRDVGDVAYRNHRDSPPGPRCEACYLKVQRRWDQSFAEHQDVEPAADPASPSYDPLRGIQRRDCEVCGRGVVVARARWRVYCSKECKSQLK